MTANFHTTNKARLFRELLNDPFGCSPELPSCFIFTVQLQLVLSNLITDYEIMIWEKLGSIRTAVLLIISKLFIILQMILRHVDSLSREQIC